VQGDIAILSPQNEHRAPPRLAICVPRALEVPQEAHRLVLHMRELDELLRIQYRIGGLEGPAWFLHGAIDDSHGPGEGARDVNSDGPVSGEGGENDGLQCQCVLVGAL